MRHAVAVVLDTTYILIFVRDKFSLYVIKDTITKLKVKHAVSCTMEAIISKFV